jgi:hypothetical protein
MKEGNKYAAEFIGTFALVFAGTGAIIINDVSWGGYKCGNRPDVWVDCSGDDLRRRRRLGSAP